MKATASLRERLRTQLADLKMPGALEALDSILAFMPDFAVLYSLKCWGLPRITPLNVRLLPGHAMTVTREQVDNRRR
jgi:hypothetical protein